MTWQTFHAITSPIRALKLLGFPNITRSDRSFEIQSRFSIHNVFRHDLTHLPCDHKPHSSIKSNRIPKYNGKRSVIKSPIRALNPLGFPNTTQSDRHDLTHIPCDHKPHSSNKSARIPTHNAKRSVLLTCAPTRFKLYFLRSSEIQSRFLINNVFRHDLTHLPCDHKLHSSIKSNPIPKYNVKRSEPHSSIKSIRIPKYNAKRSF
ncbi:uncharacterized protein G2W53_039723 [Senna tora]|uniref:Uncharacterized protein n=1 Tax=Senna tora TaxID=362788 RepID=A0A834W309_9FABA|nr:uncharacterized protein G2W53_039723 [Senna tora]